MHTVLNPLKLSDYNYDLPEDRIAVHPLAKRDAAKMLVYGPDKKIIHSQFKNLTNFLPSNTLLVLNDTRVVHARLFFRRHTGAQIEVFCLHPVLPYHEINLAMGVKSGTTWECMAGNQRRWKTGEVLTLETPDGVRLHARLIEKKGREVIVEFSWDPTDLSWAQVLEKAGKIPLPPYIHREAGEEDEQDYQTIFARQEGAVAAPTAGLHITEALLKSMIKKGVSVQYLTLHVGAGTFQPVDSENVLEHPMHREQIIFERDLINQLAGGEKYVTALGTTSMRALESLYWFGNELEKEPAHERFFVGKLQPYDNTEPVSLQKSMDNIIRYMDERKLDNLAGETEIFIFPGYDFKVCNALITNFHMPQSTLLMLVSAFIGEDWKGIYETALENNYRFLSYGDGMLLFR